MNPFQQKMFGRMRQHPELWRSLFSEPTPQTLQIIIEFHLLEHPTVNLTPWLLPVLPMWEQEACEGNEVVAQIIHQLERIKLSPISKEDEMLKPVLQRIRILASTPGFFPFSVDYIQENLSKFLECAEVIADLPEVQTIFFSTEEIAPLSNDLINYNVPPLSRRYIQNLLFPERREAILSVLAFIAKNYPLLGMCRQAYAIMLSLEKADLWSLNPFCLRLIANRSWDLQVEQTELLKNTV